MDSESIAQQKIMVEAVHYGCVLMRNNSGACIDENGRLVRYGLGNYSKQAQSKIASSDLIGITKVKITQNMVGSEIGIFTAVEVKKENWKINKKLNKREQAQSNFIDWVNSMGGRAGFCNSVDTLGKILKK